MILIDFGQGCFNDYLSEQSAFLMIAPKSLYSSMDEFVTKAVDFLERNDDSGDNWSEIYKNRVYSKLTEDDKNRIKSRLEAMNQRVSIAHEPIINAVHIIPPKWNDITIGVETEEEYIFCSWGTSV